jgi:hypothetical protein
LQLNNSFKYAAALRKYILAAYCRIDVFHIPSVLPKSFGGLTAGLADLVKKYSPYLYNAIYSETLALYRSIR